MSGEPETMELVPTPQTSWPSLLLTRILPPLLFGILVLLLWEVAVRVNDIPFYILPGPTLVGQTLVKDWGSLYPSLLVTVAITLSALTAATIAGVALAVLFAQSKWIENCLFPYAVILQVTPIVAIAPLIIIWVQDIRLALLICAWIVAFFPIVSNTTLGLNSTDHNLLSLMQLYGASRRQIFWNVRLPSALPYFLGGLRISGGLALIGAVVAEFVAGTGGVSSGLAFRILESSYTLQIPRMFAALILITATGILIFLILTFFTHLILRRWHESAMRREG
ncbi:ABC transporter permease [Pseudorhodoplanes sp.]|uniref:ABC transporter permease n=1 Tax=Pseudorhodoplanes sp. TaxID=1934341 RepID=UPI003D1109CB